MESTQFLIDSHNHLGTIRASQFDFPMNCNQPIPLVEMYTQLYNTQYTTFIILPLTVCGLYVHDTVCT